MSSNSLRPWWKKPITAAYTIALIMGTAAFMNTFLVEPQKSRAEKFKEDADRYEKLHKGVSEELKVANGKLSASNKVSELDLSAFSKYRTAYDFATKSAASGLILSDEARKKIENTPLENIEVTVIFANEQDSVELWIIDMRGNKTTRRLERSQGKLASSDRLDELSYKIPVSYLEKVDPRSISEITFEAANLKSQKGSFVVKSLVVK